jgi:hypothetical protein
MHPSPDHFSETFAEARRRFQAAAAEVGATIHTYPIDAENRDELAIDVAIVGADTSPTIVTSSGIHGVEGFFGSAVQHAILDRRKHESVEPDVRHVLIHGLNPFGFSCLRRFNEENVDLNRNFFDSGDGYKGAPDVYAGLNGFLNPESPPSRLEPFKLKAIWSIWRNGKQALKQAVAGGQYEFPRGLFFGGHGPCQSTKIVCENCDHWIGDSEKIFHVDFHSGLGPFGTYKLLLAESADSATYAWYTAAFGSEYVEPLDTPEGTAYKVSGLFGAWMQKHFQSREYRFVGAEFGTFEIVRVLRAIRAENRAHHYSSESSAIYRSAKAELLECFCPLDASWRKQVVEKGLKIVAQGAEAISQYR